jgi:hypothetical protein
MKTTIRAVLMAVTSLYLAAGDQKLQAVIPPPDGGYPGFNTAEGQNALFSLTTGSANTAVGWFSLFSNAQGSFNTATGAGALLLIPQTKIRRLARQRFYLMSPASATQPSEPRPS